MVISPMLGFGIAFAFAIAMMYFLRQKRASKVNKIFGKLQIHIMKMFMCKLQLLSAIAWLAHHHYLQCLLTTSAATMDVYSGMTRTIHFKANQTSNTVQGISVVLKC
jgi:hypothetical protein